MAKKTAVVCHHAGFYTDWLTIDASESYTWLYNSGGTYAPADITRAHSPKYIFMSCGSKENPEGVKKAAEDLRAAGFNAESYVSEGTAHEFLTWRRSLYVMAQKLFK